MKKKIYRDDDDAPTVGGNYKKIKMENRLIWWGQPAAASSRPTADINVSLCQLK